MITDPRFTLAVGAILVSMATSACEDDPSPVPPPRGDANALPAPAPESASDNPELQAITARLPAGWSGIGVLEQRDPVPPGAPAWVRVVAEIVEQNGKRYLHASGIAPRIKNPALARTASGNRARAELLRWIGSQRLVGSEITDHWEIPGQASYARARLQVPATWQPGQRLPPDPGPSDEPDVATP